MDSTKFIQVNTYKQLICAFLRLAVLFVASCGRDQIFEIFYFLLLKFSAGKPLKYCAFASCGGLRVLAAQQILAPLLAPLHARALLLYCTVT